jgi:hypothetical protein
MYPKWGSLFVMVFLVIMVIIIAVMVDSNASSIPALTPSELTRLEDFQQLRRGDLLTDTIEGQVVPVMLVIEAHVKELKVDLGGKKSTTMKINARMLSSGKMQITKRGSADWCYLIEKFYAKK